MQDLEVRPGECSGLARWGGAVWKHLGHVGGIRGHSWLRVCAYSTTPWLCSKPPPLPLAPPPTRPAPLLLLPPVQVQVGALHATIVKHADNARLAGGSRGGAGGGTSSHLERVFLVRTAADDGTDRSDWVSYAVLMEMPSGGHMFAAYQVGGVGV
jgi:hypothetical protein